MILTGQRKPHQHILKLCTPVKAFLHGLAHPLTGLVARLMPGEHIRPTALRGGGKECQIAPAVVRDQQMALPLAHFPSKIYSASLDLARVCRAGRKLRQGH